MTGLKSLTMILLITLPVITIAFGKISQGAMSENMPLPLMILMALANGLTAFAYFSVSVVLVVFVRRRKDIPFSGIFILFGAFIFACGLTHLMHAMGLWAQVDGWQALVDSLTALISVTSAVLLWPLLPRLLAIPSPEQLRVTNLQLSQEKAALERAQSELQKAYTEVEQRVQERTQDLAVELQKKLEAETQTLKLNRLYTVLSDINQAIVHNRKLSPMFEMACQIMVEGGGFGLAWIGLLSPADPIMRPVASAGRTGQMLQGLEISLIHPLLVNCPADEVLRTGKRVVHNVMSPENPFLTNPELLLNPDFGSAASFPLIVNNTLRGTFNVYANEAEHFDDAELKLLDKLALDLSFAIQFAEIEEQRLWADQEVEKNNRLLTTLINSPTDIIIFSLDRQYRYLTFNEKHHQEMRKIWGAEIETGTNMLEWMTIPSLRVAAQHSFDRALAGEYFTEIQFQPEANIYYEFTWSPIRLANREVTGLTAFIRDISEQKRAAEAVNTSERRYRLSQKAAHIGSWEWEIATDRLTWSDEMFNVFDKDPLEFTPSNQSVFDSMLGEDKAAALAAVEAAVTYGIPFHSEYRILDRNQHLKWVESKGEVVFNDQKQPLRAAGTVQDITARKQAEEALRKSQVLLNETQRITRVGGWEFDPLTNKVTWTDEVYQIHGVTKEYDPSSVNHDIQFYAPEDQGRISEAFQRMLETGQPYDLEAQLVTAQGHKLWVRTAGHAEQQEGKITRVFGNIMDISERKRAEIQLTEQIEELRRWHSVTLGREARILDLKREVNQLLAQTGQPARYHSVEADKH